MKLIVSQVLLYLAASFIAWDFAWPAILPSAGADMRFLIGLGWVFVSLLAHLIFDALADI